MMSGHFGLSSELAGAIAKRLPHAKNQPSTPGSFFNQFVTYIYIYIYIQARFACLRCAACGHYVSAESPCGRLEQLNLNYFLNFFPLYMYCKQRSTNNFSYGSENMIFEIYTPKNPMSTVES